MRSKFYTNKVLIFLIVIFIICPAGISLHAKANDISHSLNSRKGPSTASIEFQQQKIQHEAILEVASFEPIPHCIRRNQLFLSFPLNPDLPVKVIDTFDINQLSLIRKDNIFLSILRI